MSALRLRTLVPALLASVFLFFDTARAAPAAPFPEHAVQFVVANSPGSAPDVLARYVGERLQPAWHQPVTVLNRPGAAGVMAADGIAKAQPDGLQLLVGADGPITILPSLGAHLPYDPARDLVPVVSLGRIDFVLVANPKTGWHSLADFVDAARRQPGRFNYASAGNGSPQQMGMELLKQRAGIYVTHIPYRGGPLAMQDVIGGQVDVMLIAIGPALPQIRSGRLVALGVSGERANPLLPGVPAIAERYAGYRAGTWFGLFAPAGTPPATLHAIETSVAKVLHTPQARTDLAAQGIDATGDGHEVFGASVLAEAGRYRKTAQFYGLQAD